MKIILASASPRRKELLSQLIKDFEIIPAKGEERVKEGLAPEEVACALAEHKCDEVFESNSGALVIACDTIVVYGEKILGKPKDKADAAATLKMLSGNKHRVITGVCMRSCKGKICTFDTTEVQFNQLSDEFIQNYVDGGSPMDKAGSYGIQDGGVVKSYSGSFTNVVGFPVELCGRIIKDLL